MKKIVGLWALLFCYLPQAFSQVDTSFIYNTNMPYGTLDLRIAKSETRYYYLQENVTFSYRESSPGVKTNTFRDMTSWDSRPFKEGNLRERNGDQDLFVMNYRILFPNNYDPNYEPGYPIIIMLHGYGERGNCWNNNCYWSTPSWNPNTNSPAAPTSETHNLLNNDHNLLHGGQKHLTAVNLAGSKLPDDPTLPSTAFPGIVLFPQVLNGWQQTARVEEAIKILRLVIKKYNVDQNRVYIHALSNGGGGLYQAVKRAPWLFAAALPMSAVSNGGVLTEGMAQEVGKIPFWVFQGGKDKNPTPSKTYNTVKGLREAGASVRYYLYPNLGHGTWNTAYNEPDFFSWILEKRKYNPHVYYGNPVICNTTATGVRISFSNGFRAYQWEQDGEIIAGATFADFVAMTPGTYRGRFSRKANPQEGEWEPWSQPIEVTEISPAKPAIEVLTSTHLRGPGLVSTAANNTVQLKSQQQAELYTWYKNGTIVDFPGTDVNDTLRTAIFTSAGSGANGAYTLKTHFSYCPSPPSDPVYLFFNNSAPQNLTFNAASADFKGKNINNGVLLTWNDIVSGESAYEIWRRKSGTNVFQYVGRTPKNSISFFDGTVESSTTYEYKIRAVGNAGRSNYVPSDDLNINYSILTPGDATPPLPPQDLKVIINTINSITLSWKPAIDNTGVKSYKIVYGNQEIQTDTSLTAFTITGLSANTIYPITVKAVDFAGNVSLNSNQVIASTYVIGLFYKHSTGGWETLDDSTLVETWYDPEFTGHVSNFSLAPRTQEDFFDFQYTGYIDILTEGDYIFRLTSNDGSRMFIDNALVIDNDGVHGNVTKFSDTLHLPKGPHWVELQYFDYAGSQTLTVQWKGPDLSQNYKVVPDSLLRSGKYIAPAPPAAPDNLIASGTGIQRIDLSWTLNGNDVEIFRSLAANENFEIVGRASTGAWIDTLSLDPGRTYYYKIRTASNTGISDFSTTAAATTQVDNIVPTAPTDIAVTNKSHTQVALTWTPSTDNAAVKAYEIYVDGILKGTSSMAAYTMTGLDPNTTYMIMVRAVDASNNHSAFSSTFPVTTSPSAIYYSMASGPLNALSTWKQNSNGTGSSPVDFLESGQYFVIANRTSTSIGGPWDVSGGASKVIVSNGVTLTIDNIFVGQIELEGNSVLNLNSESIPDFSKVSPASTVNFNIASQIPAMTFGNVGIGGSGTSVLEADSTFVLGNISVASGSTLKGAPGNSSVLFLSGNFNYNGVPAPVAADNRIHLVVSDNTSHNLLAPSKMFFYQITAGVNAVVTMDNSSHGLVLGSLHGGGTSLGPGSLLDLQNGSIDLIGASAINAEAETGTIAVNGGDIRIMSISSADSHLYFKTDSHAVDTLKVDLTAGGRLMIESAVDVAGAVIVNGGELGSNGFVTLKSSASGSAYIAEIGAGGLITGNVNVIHFIPAMQNQWLDLSTPVSNVTVSDWQNYFPVTGQFAGASSGNTDPSMMTSNGSGLTAYPASGTDNQSPIQRGVGYETKMLNTSEVMLVQTGVPFQHEVSIPLIGGNSTSTGWSLVGNPYAAPIYWSNNSEAIAAGGVNQTIAIRENFTINGLPVARYRYETMSLSSVPIEACQGFWVKSTSVDPSLMIREKAKIEPSPGHVDHLIVSMKQNPLDDRVLIIFSDAATNGFDPNLDALKRPNEGMFNFSLLSGNEAVAVSQLSANFCSVTVKLNIANASPGNYSLAFDSLQAIRGVGTATLIDNFLHTSKIIDGADYPFSITSEAGSSGSERFAIQFTRSQLDLTTPQVSAKPACSAEHAEVQIAQTQAGVDYHVLNVSGQVISEVVEGTGETVTLDVPVSFLSVGNNSLQIQAGFPGCNSGVLQSTATLTYSGPVVITANDISVCIGEQATVIASGIPSGGHYQWFDESGTVIPGENSASYSLLASEETSVQVGGVLADGCVTSPTTVHIYADSLDVPVISLYRDTLFVQMNATMQWFRNGNLIPGATQSFYPPAVTGDYTVVASANGCSHESLPYQYVIDPGCSLDTSISKVSLESSCGSDQANIVVTGSRTDVKYSVINANDEAITSSYSGNGGSLSIPLNITALDSGQNHVRVRADLAGCINRTLDNEIDIDPVRPFEISAEDSVYVCKGIAATLHASGVPAGGLYSWYLANGDLVASATDSTFTTPAITASTYFEVRGVHSSGCISEPQRIIVIPIDFTIPQVMLVDGVLTSAMLPGNYQWYLNGNAIQDAISSEFIPVTAGMYTVKVSQAGCEVSSAPYIFVLTSTGEPPVSVFALQVFPVPAQSAQLRIGVQSPSADPVTIVIFDLAGRHTFRQTYYPKDIAIASGIEAHLTDGIYTIEVQQGRNVLRRKIVIRN